MLPGKRDFYRCCKARRSASHVNKEFWQQFQNYAPPSLRVIRTQFARHVLYVIVINQMRGLYGIYKSRDTRAKPEWQGFMNRVQTERWFITILKPASIAYVLGTLLTSISTFSPLIHFSMTHTRLYQIYIRYKVHSYGPSCPGNGL